MKTGKNRAQALIEFVLIAPIILFILLGIVEFAKVCLDKQRLEMASYYATRLYSKVSIRGVKRGSIIAYNEKKQRIFDEIIRPRVENLLNRSDVEITNPKGNQIKITMPAGINFGVDGIGGISKKFTLEATGEMENDSLTYGGGRSGEDVLGLS